MSFRPIAPAEPAMDVYQAACNPPRRAKRPRPDSPAPPSHDEDEDGDELPHPPPKRRGRRSGTLSRAAREAQRKINHSLIEKARRTKINDALATLRELVPPDSKRAPDTHDDSDPDPDDPRRPRPKPRAPAEKEFKLEILVRTVAYLQDLTDRVRQLERDGCPRCNEPISFSPDDPPSPKPRDASAPPSRLPSISSWLPATVADPLHSPALDGTTSARSSQLLTPPTSATCAPASSGFPVPPVLTLPSPSTFLPPTSRMQPRFFGFAPRAAAGASPGSSPGYTPEDETAASLLLRMSATSPRKADTGPAGYALTPSRLLGLSAQR